MTVTLPHRRARLLVTAAVATLGSLNTTCSGGSTKSSGFPTTGRSSATTAAPLVAASLKGVGSGFQKSFDQAAIRSFTAAHPGITVAYAPASASTALSQFAGKVADFAGSDTPIADYGPYGGPDAVLYVPTVGAPITISYNLPGVSRLTLSAGTIAKIFSGKVATWNDPALAVDNPGVALPTTRLTPVHLSEPSGTTRNFTLYLAKAAPVDWALGTGTTVGWPSETGATGSPGVAQVVKSTPGSIGYVEFPDAKTSDLTMASVRNLAGRVVDPTLVGASAAMSGALVNANVTYDPTNTPGPDAYPITSPSWIVVYRTQIDKGKGAALKAFLTYLLNEGQVGAAGDTNFAPLPANLMQAAKAQIDRIVLAPQ
jgi:phosphate transport system substrate-binding protein